MIFSSDKPITSKTEDRLNRSKFADQLAENILSYSGKENMVISLDGKWGTGKTSILNMVRESIAEKSISKKDLLFVPSIVSYSPWNTLNEESLIKEFFGKLANSFKTSSIKRILKKIQKSALINLGFAIGDKVPLLNCTPQWKAAKGIKSCFDSYVSSLNESDGDINIQKERLEQQLRKTKLKTIVFIDDIDRCDDTEIIEILRLIKSICCFENTIYVIAYDKEMVAKAVEKKLDRNGNEFLEKIVQVEFAVPEATPSAIKTVIGQDLQSVLDSNKLGIDEKRLPMAMAYGLFSKIDTLRKEKRYLNSLSLKLLPYSKEMDVTDLLIMEYLSVSYPGIVSFLSDWSSYLFGRNIRFSGSDDFNEQERNFKSELKNKFGDDTDLYGLINQVFTFMFTYTSNDTNDGAIKKRLSNKGRFDFYLNGQLDVDQISIDSFKVAMASKSIPTLKEYLNNISESQRRMFFALCVDYVDEISKIGELSFLFDFFLSEIGSFKCSEGIFLLPKEGFAYRVVQRMKTKFSNDEIISFLVDHIERGKDLNAIIRLGMSIGNEINDSGTQDFVSNPFSKDQVEKINSAIIEEVMPSFSKTPTPELSLYRFLFLEKANPEGLSKAIDSMSTQEKIVFLSGLITNGTISSSEGTNTTYSYGYFALMEKFFDFVELRPDIISTVKEAFAKQTQQKETQSLLVLLMIIDKWPFQEPKRDCFIADDINEYAAKNKIPFVARDDYFVE
jgi:hypothetical protein